MTSPLTILLAHDQADLYADRLHRRFPFIEFGVAACENALHTLGPHFAPTIAYSCSTGGFPRAHHRSILDMPSIRWLHVGGSGFEHFSAWDPDRVILTNGVGVLAPYLADTVMGVIIALNNGFFDHRKNQLDRTWRPKRFRALRDQILLVVGPGAVGSALARLAKAHGMLVIGAARRPAPRDGFDEVSAIANLPDLVGGADWVSLHLRLTSETAKMFDRAMFAHMRRDTYLLNTSRGGIVDEAALVEALRQRNIAGAYLDVTATEPLPEDSPIWHIDNLFLTPHCSDQVIDWQERHADLFMDNLDRWLRNEPLLNRVTSKPA